MKNSIFVGFQKKNVSLLFVGSFVAFFRAQNAVNSSKLEVKKKTG